MSGLTLVPMSRAHIPEIIAIEDDLFDSPWTEPMFRQEVADDFLSRSWVAVVDGRVVGYMVTWFLREEVHLLNIAVARAHQGNGYARRMLSELIDRSVRGGRDLITLEVRESNDSARRLYDAHGFVVVGRRKNYYQDNREDAVVMTLDVRDLRGGEDV